MIYRPLGTTGLEVSALGFGPMRLPMVEIGTEKYVDFDRAVQTMRRAFELGVNYVDNGFIYCSQQSELAVGRALQGYRERVIVTDKATKFRMANPGDLRRMLEHQLQRLQTDYLDFYCFHGIGFENFHEIDSKTGWVGDMHRAKDEGLVRRIGFSFHDRPEGLAKLVDLGLFEMVTCQYNYLDRSNEEGIRHAASKGLAVVVMGPVGGGRLAELPRELRGRARLDASGAAALAIRFVLSNPNVHVVLSGMGTPEMVEENCRAVENGPFSEQERRDVGVLLDERKELAELYCTGCGYCMPCEHGVQIPERFAAMNSLRVWGMESEARQAYRQIRQGEAKSAGGGECVECGECEPKCPQSIPIIEQLKETEAALGS